MQIKLFASFRLKGGGDRVEVTVGPDSTVADALEALCTKVPVLREHLLEPGTGLLQQHVQIMLKGRLIRDLQGLETPVTNEDAMAIFPPVAGG